MSPVRFTNKERVSNQILSAVVFTKTSSSGVLAIFSTGTYAIIGTCASSLKHVMNSTTKKRLTNKVSSPGLSPSKRDSSAVDLKKRLIKTSFKHKKWWAFWWLWLLWLVPPVLSVCLSVCLFAQPSHNWDFGPTCHQSCLSVCDRYGRRLGL